MEVEEAEGSKRCEVVTVQTLGATPDKVPNPARSETHGHRSDRWTRLYDSPSAARPEATSGVDDSAGRRDQKPARIEPETLCHTEKMAAGRAAIGAKCAVARAAASPEFCIPTSMLTARRPATGCPR